MVIALNRAPTSHDSGDLRLRLPLWTAEIARLQRQVNAVAHCDFRVQWKIARDLRIRAKMSGPKFHSFCGNSGNLAVVMLCNCDFWCT